MQQWAGRALRPPLAGAGICRDLLSLAVRSDSTSLLWNVIVTMSMSNITNIRWIVGAGLLRESASQHTFSFGLVTKVTYMCQQCVCVCALSLQLCEVSVSIENVALLLLKTLRNKAINVVNPCKTNGCQLLGGPLRIIPRGHIQE